MKRLPSWLSNSVTPLMIIVGLLFVLREEPPIRFVTQVYPPYQYLDEHGVARGSAVDMVRCAMQRAGRTFTLTVVPGDQWEQAQDDVRDGKYDGFFSALFTVKRSEFAAWSTSIITSQAYYVQLRDSHVDPHSPSARWGVKGGSGVQATLQNAPIHITDTFSDNPQLVRGLLDGKVDVIYIDLAILKWAAQYIGLNDKPLQGTIIGTPDTELLTEHFKMRPVSSQDYGIYVSRAYLRSHAALMDGVNGLNAAIGRCRITSELP